MTYTADPRWNNLMTEHELAYFRADVCLDSPQSYSIDEKRQICEEMEASTAEIDAAMRSDFEAMPPTAQAKMMNLLQQADPDHFDWWKELLLGKTPDSPDEILAQTA